MRHADGQVSRPLPLLNDGSSNAFEISPLFLTTPKKETFWPLLPAYGGVRASPQGSSCPGGWPHVHVSEVQPGRRGRGDTDVVVVDVDDDDHDDFHFSEAQPGRGR